MKGRKPIPDALKALAGQTRPDRMNPEQPVAPSDGLQFIPDELSEEGKKYWPKIRATLVAAGIATNLDRQALIMLCETWATYLEAVEGLRSDGLMIVGTAGRPVKSQYLAVINQQSAILNRLMVEFGMTPTSRQRLRSSDGGPPQGNAGDFDDV